MNELIKVADSAKDKAARMTGIGASDAPAVLGLLEYRSARDVYDEKIGEGVPRDEENEDLIRGEFIEPWVVSKYMRLPGYPAVTQYSPGMFRHPDYPFVLASPDALLEGNRGLEGKSMRDYVARNELGRPGTDEVPDSWIVQAQQQMAVCGLDEILFPVQIDFDTECPVYVVGRNEQLIASILEANSELWDCIQRRVPPCPSQWAKSVAAVKRVFRTVDPYTAVQLSHEACDLLRDAKAQESAAKQASETADLLKAEAYAEIGNAEYGLLNDGTAIKRISIGESTYTAVRKAHVQYRWAKVPKEISIVPSFNRIEESQ